jgi:hypothetical protein
MPDFTHTIDVNNERVRFLFSKIHIPGRIKFLVTVLFKNLITSFDIQQDKKGDWKIVHPVPDWLIFLEQELVSAIKNSLAINQENRRTGRAEHDHGR